MAADRVHALVRAVCIVISRAPRREILLRLCCLLRDNELSRALTTCHDAQVLPNGLEIEKFRANQNVRLFRLTKRVFAQSHGVPRIPIRLTAVGICARLLCLPAVSGALYRKYLDGLRRTA
jgi:hypothetical protein